LDAAVAWQRDAAATWRSALADLSKVMSGLGETIQHYRGSLDTLGTRVANRHAQAVHRRCRDGNQIRLRPISQDFLP
jgi:hypothetical protein